MSKRKYQWHRTTTIPTSEDLVIQFVDDRGDLYWWNRNLFDMGIDTPKKWFDLCVKYKIKKWRYKQ